MFEASSSTRLSASAPLDREGAQLIRRPRPKRQRTALSFEIIPPRPTDDPEKIDQLIAGLAEYKPDYVSVTSSRRSEWLEGTAAVISRISETTDLRTIAHLACTAGTRDEMAEWVRVLIDAGVRGFLALRGDLPEEGLPADHLQYATDLLNLIQDVQEEEAFRLAAGKLALSVACYPKGHEESRNFDHDLDVLLTKQRLGADFAITQLFFEAQDFMEFVEVARLAGVRIPLIPGIMPMTSLKRIRRMGELSGLEVPVGVEKQLLEADNEYEAGMQLTANLAREILDAGAGGLHVYTHNNLHVTRDFLDRIGIDKGQQ